MRCSDAARHQGQDGYVTVVSGPTFAWFGSADNKIRIGILTHLHDGQPSYVLNDLALEPLAKLPRRHLLRGSIRSPGAIFLANEACPAELLA